MDSQEKNKMIGREDVDAILESPDGLEEAEEIVANPPSFPILILLVALVKDFSDIISFGFLAPITTPLTYFILTIWLLGKGSMVKKMLIKRVISKHKKGLIFKNIPILAIYPQFTILIFYAHFAQTKFVKELEYLLKGVYYGRGITLKGMAEIAYA